MSLDQTAALNDRAATIANLAGAQIIHNDARGYFVRFVSGREEDLGGISDAEEWLSERAGRESDGRLTYDCLDAAWAVGVEVDPGDLLLQTGRYACVWRVRASMPYEDGGQLGYVAELVEEGASSLVYALERLRADGVSGPNGGPIVGVYSAESLPTLRDRVATELAAQAEE
jgi:hypothetical protein